MDSMRIMATELDNMLHADSSTEQAITTASGEFLCI